MNITPKEPIASWVIDHPRAGGQITKRISLLPKIRNKPVVVGGNWRTTPWYCTGQKLPCKKGWNINCKDTLADATEMWMACCRLKFWFVRLYAYHLWRLKLMYRPSLLLLHCSSQSKAFRPINKSHHHVRYWCWYWLITTWDRGGRGTITKGYLWGRPYYN